MGLGLGRTVTQVAAPRLDLRQTLLQPARKPDAAKVPDHINFHETRHERINHVCRLVEKNQSEKPGSAAR